MGNAPLPNFDELIVLAYYSELSPEENSQFEAILAQDESKRTLYKNYCQQMDIMNNVPLVEPSEDFWSALSYNIHTQIRRGETPDVIRQPLPKPNLWSNIKEMFLSPQGLGVTLAGALGCVIVGLFIGAKIQPTWITGVDKKAVAAAASSQKITDFLRRSQLYLMTVVVDQSTSDCTKSPEDLNKEIAKDLLTEATLIRQQQVNNEDLQKLIQNLEFVLNTSSSDVTKNSPQVHQHVRDVASTAICEVSSKIDSVRKITIHPIERR